MADTKTTALTENTAPLGSDLNYMVDDPAGTPASQKIYKGSDNILPDGYMINGKLSVTVGSNNLTVALKTKSGGDPSATDPVSVWINGTYRRCTAALAVTKNAGTNWCNSGGTELATKEADYFVYLLWNTTPATDIMDIGFARIPDGRVYSDFSGTTTNEKYLAFANASTPTATDDCVNVGRFAATLSATAAFNWSVPTFTSINKIDTPTYVTRWLTYVPAFSGNNSMTYTSVTATLATYRIANSTIDVWVYATGTVGGTPSTALQATLPFEAVQVANFPPGYGYVTDTTSVPGRMNLTAGTPDILQAIRYDNAAYGAGAGRIMSSRIMYQI